MGDYLCVTAPYQDYGAPKGLDVEDFSLWESWKFYLSGTQINFWKLLINPKTGGSFTLSKTELIVFGPLISDVFLKLR